MMKQRLLVPAALGLITFLALLPGVMYFISGDRIVHDFYLKCFASDMWRGVLYPRWCMEATGGLGSPVFMYYFPLPYFVSAIFYPLVWTGMDIDEVLSVLLWVVTLAAACTGYRWLRTLTTRNAALAGTALYILSPYHAELLLYRVAYAELWFMALLPFYLVRLSACARGDKGEWWKLGIVYGLLVLAHPAGAMIAAVGTGAYLGAAWWQAGRAGRGVVQHGTWQALAGGALGMAISAVYWLPAQHYKQYAVSRTPDLPWPVVDRYPALITGLRDGFDKANHGTIYIGTFITLLFITTLSFMAWRVWRRPEAAEIAPLASELRRYMVVAVVALFFYLPILEPLWLSSPFIQNIIFPWRFQLWWVPLLALLAAFFTEAHGRLLARVRIGDAAVLVGFLVLMSFSMVYYIMPGQDEEVKRVKKMMYLSVYPFAPKWLETVNYLDFKFVMNQMDDPHVLKHAPGTKVEVLRWEAGEIRLKVNAKAADTLILRHLYFPAWESLLVKDGATLPLKLSPQEKTARMVFTVPPGQSEVRLRYRPYVMMVREWLD